MIAASAAGPQPRWQALWRTAVTDAGALLRELGLAHLAASLPERDAGFPLRAPPGFVARMRHGDPQDPLLLQVLPQLVERNAPPGALLDPVGDAAAKAAPGVIQKYHGRALLIASGACAIHCRYCFRRHFPYERETAAAGRWQTALDWLRAHPDIDEVILSGGDPLSLSTGRIAELTDALRGMPQLRRLRIHSRLPVVLPERVDESLCRWLADLPWPVALVLHANHANELDDTVGGACARLRAANANLLNQTVLLRGVNATTEALAALSTRLFSVGVLPYYLHQLDPVQGAMHFAVDDAHALSLLEALRQILPGYLVPRLVREEPGAPSKTALGAS